MDWLCQCVAVIPCFNESRQIAKVVAQVRAFLPHVIVVDDGSTDGTGDAARAAGAEVIRLSTKLGKGNALRIGWQRAKARGFTWVLMLDGDGQHAPQDMPGFFERAEKSAARLVVGNRLGHAENMPWLRRRINRWMTDRLSRLTGVKLADSQCGFRLAHLKTLSRLPVATNHFEVESEMLVAFLEAGCRVEFVPVQVIYNNDASKIRPLPDTWRWLRWWLAQRQNVRRLKSSRVSAAFASRKLLAP